MKEAGFKGYYDIEVAGKEYSGIAMFNSNDIKGVFADFDPESVPEGRRYDEDIMFSRKRVGTTGQYIGAPRGIDTPAKLRYKNSQESCGRGEYGRFWYEKSSKQILDLVGGNQERS